MSKVKAWAGGFLACMCDNPLVITGPGNRLNQRAIYCGLCGKNAQNKDIDAAVWKVGGVGQLPKYEDLKDQDD